MSVGSQRLDSLADILNTQVFHDIQALEGDGGLERSLALVDVMGRSKIGIEDLDQLGISLDDVQNVFTGEGILTKTLLQFGKHLLVYRVGTIQDGCQTQVFLTQSVEEVLGKDPSNITIGHFLNGECVGLEVLLERGLGKTVQERGFLHDLVDGVLNRGRFGIRGRMQVKTDDGDTIGELFYLRIYHQFPWFHKKKGSLFSSSSPSHFFFLKKK
jgi:hypothetical protein